MSDRLDVTTQVGENVPTVETSIQRRQGRAVCMIASGRMLGVGDVRHWLAKFREYSRRVPSDIVLPAVGFAGPWYDSDVHPAQPSSAGLLPDWIRQARDSNPSAVIWASIIFDFSFLGNEALWLRNQYDDDLAQACATNPATQAVLGELCSEVLNLGVDGIVLDVTDAVPNAGSEQYVEVSAHCFCMHCMDALRRESFPTDRTEYMGSSSLLRFVLRHDDDGTAHIDPPHVWIEQLNATGLIAHARNRRFIHEDDDDLAGARRCLEYFRARATVMAENLRTICQPMRQAQRRSALILGSHAADLSQMTTLDSLVSAQAADEYWLPDLGSPVPGGSASSASTLQFLSSRATYNVNSFFEVVETSAQLLRLGGAQTLIERLFQTSKRLMSNKLSPGAAYVSETLAQYSGFVGIPLGENDHLDIVRQAAAEVKIPTLSDDVLDALRIIDPDRSQQ